MCCSAMWTLRPGGRVVLIAGSSVRGRDHCARPPRPFARRSSPGRDFSLARRSRSLSCPFTLASPQPGVQRLDANRTRLAAKSLSSRDRLPGASIPVGGSPPAWIRGPEITTKLSSRAMPQPSFLDGDAVALTERVADAGRPPYTPPSMTGVGQGTVRRMTQFPVPLLRTNVKPARSKRVRVPL